ncbi:hypothetical protein AAF712_012003 [Marasmius tenuissimus]|uniref:Uncharacterized protein n=1 Tax=Marasmius tenuissimus TaxID=585030 RepID=A0ABR2ZIP6_9AGAR
MHRPRRKEIVVDPFQRRLTDFFSVTKIERFFPPNLRAREQFLIFYHACGRKTTLVCRNLPLRARLSDYRRSLFKARIAERPQLRVLKIEGSSFEWGYIGWREYFNLPSDGKPMFFSLFNNVNDLPEDWVQDITIFLDSS